jgi:3-methylcrotonyl-CoA carboxylase alpha subunit
MLDSAGNYYFLEMNTRLQVEHPVTELVYGVDLVHWQLRIASGEPLTISQDDVRPRGWSIETRIYAEDPANHMLPSTGTIEQWIPPEGPGIRLDSGVAAGSDVSVYYDPMLAKLIVYGSDRAAAVARMEAALDDFVVDGVRTNIPLLSWIVRDQAFRDGATTTGFLAERLDESIFTKPQTPPEAAILCCAALLLDGLAPWRLAGVGMPIHLISDDGASFDIAADVTADENVWRLSGSLTGKLHVWTRGTSLVAQLGDAPEIEGTASFDDDDDFVVQTGGQTYSLGFADPPSLSGAAAAAGASAPGRVSSPMPGKIVKIAVSPGEAVEERALLVVLEAMKMEHRIEADAAGEVKNVFVREGEIVSGGAPLVEIG